MRPSPDDPQKGGAASSPSSPIKPSSAARVSSSRIVDRAAFSRRVVQHSRHASVAHRGHRCEASHRGCQRRYRAAWWPHRKMDRSSHGSVAHFIGSVQATRLMSPGTAMRAASVGNDCPRKPPKALRHAIAVSSAAVNFRQRHRTTLNSVAAKDAWYDSTRGQCCDPPSCEEALPVF